MSVDLIITYNDTREDIPVSASQSFMDYWIKPAETLNLKLVPTMDGIGNSDKDYYTELVAELHTLKEHLRLIQDEDERRIQAIKRMSRTIDALENALANWDRVHSISIG